MDEDASVRTVSSGRGGMGPERTVSVLRQALRDGAAAGDFERLSLDREAAAAFIAEQATLLSAVAHAAGLSTVKIISDILYVHAFGDATTLDRT